jgi:hypothetical protein
MDSGFCRALLLLSLSLTLWNMEGLVSSEGLDIPKPPHWTILNELIDRGARVRCCNWRGAL